MVARLSISQGSLISSAGPSGNLPRWRTDWPHADSCSPVMTDEGFSIPHATGFPAPGEQPPQAAQSVIAAPDDTSSLLSILLFPSFLAGKHAPTFTISGTLSLYPFTYLVKPVEVQWLPR